MAEEIRFKVSKQIRIEAVEGGIFCLSIGSPDGKTYGERVSVTNAAALVKQLVAFLGLEKKTRKARTTKAPTAPAAPAAQ